MKGYREPVIVTISERDANTLRLAVFAYASLLRDIGRPYNSLSAEALGVAQRLLDDATKAREGVS